MKSILPRDGYTSPVGTGAVDPVQAPHTPQATPSPLLHWDEQQGTKFVRAAVARKRGMFNHYPDLSDDDLVQTILIECRKDFPKFDAGKSSFSTWVGRVAGTTLIDLWRSRARRADRDAAYASRPSPATRPDDTEPDDRDLAAWLREVYLLAKRTFTARRHRQGRRFHNVAQQVACALLMERLKLSERGAAALLRERVDLAAAVRFRHVPHHSWFGRVGEVAALFLEKSEKSAGANKTGN